jgi:hypothetical protein
LDIFLGEVWDEGAIMLLLMLKFNSNIRRNERKPWDFLAIASSKRSASAHVRQEFNNLSLTGEGRSSETSSNSTFGFSSVPVSNHLLNPEDDPSKYLLS